MLAIYFQVNKNIKFQMNDRISMFPQKSAKITPCTLCKSLRSSAEMIESTNNLGKTELFCSVNCLSAYRVKMVTSAGKFILLLL